MLGFHVKTCRYIRDDAGILCEDVWVIPRDDAGVSGEVGWSGGAMVLGKIPVPGRPTNLGKSRARAYCACSECGWGVVWIFFSHLSFLFSFSLSLGDGPI